MDNVASGIVFFFTNVEMNTIIYREIEHKF